MGQHGVLPPDDVSPFQKVGPRGPPGPQGPPGKPGKDGIDVSLGEMMGKLLWGSHSGPKLPEPQA